MILLVFVILLTFGAVVFRGAPYIPTHGKKIYQALDLLGLKKGDLVVDLGCGDGVFLKAAAKHGLKAVGYEINPILCVVAWLRCWPVRGQVKIYWRDFWLMPLPPDTKGVFVFLAGPYMQKLGRKIQQEAAKRPLKVVSYGFTLPGLQLATVKQGLNLYKIGF